MRRIRSGALNYILAAQNITDNMARTVEFLNHSMRTGRFFGMGLVKFEGDGVVVFETRTVARPSKGPTGPQTTTTNAVRASTDSISFTALPWSPGTTCA